MTNEEKQILLKDLCARLPYEVKLYHEDDYGDNIGKLESININDDECVIWNYNETDTDIFDNGYVDCACPDDKQLKNFEDLQNKDA